MAKTIVQLVRRSAKTGDRKAPVKEQQAAATPPANSGGLDQTAMTAAINAGIAEAMKPFAALLGAQQSQLSTAEGKSEPLTTEQLLKVLDDRDQKRNDQVALQGKRDKFMTEKMGNVPAIYRDQLGSDPAKWEAEEQSIRGRFQADLKTAGVTAPNVNGDLPANSAQVKDVVDMSKMSAFDKIGLGLRTAKNAMFAQATTPEQVQASAAATRAALGNTVQ